jgi:arabinose-5-phosphate isomerase
MILRVMNDVQLLNEVIRTLKLEGEAISDLAQTVATATGPHAKQWLLAIRLLNASLEKNGKIVVTGVGKSGKIAQKISATLSSTGSFSVFLHPTEGLHGDLGYVRENDVVLALSYTGNTEELLRILPSFKDRKIPIIAITGNPKSQLGLQSSAVLDASVKEEACPHKLAPTTSSTLALAVGDALAIALMRLRGFDSQSFAKNHPGGSLGRKLHLTVSEVMHQGDGVAMVSADTPMDQVIIASTQKKLGAVAVCDGPQQKLLGIITDGDIRRALSHREKFFGLKAKEVMSSSPITASPEMMAVEALALMQNRPSQISVLPVINPKSEFLGLIRLHDIIQAF